MQYSCSLYLEEKSSGGEAPRIIPRLLDACRAFESDLQARDALIGSIQYTLRAGTVSIRADANGPQVDDRTLCKGSGELFRSFMFRAPDLNFAILLLSRHPALGRGVVFELHHIENATFCKPL